MPRPLRLCVRLLLTVLLLAAVFAAFPARPAAAADVVTIVGNTTREIPKAFPATIAFPLRLTAAGAKPAIAAKVTDVQLGTAPQAVTGLSAAVDKRTLQLRLTITAGGQFARAGNYTVAVLLTAASNTQRIELTLTRSPAALSAGGTVEVVDYDGWLSSHNRDQVPPLTLPVGAGGTLISLSAAQTERVAGLVRAGTPAGDKDTCPGGAASQAGLGESGRFCPLDAGGPVALINPIGPDGTLRLLYDTSGFPLGTSTRVIELRSPQLAAPVDVTFTITRKLSPALLPVFALLGILAGLFIRVVLTQAIDRQQRRRIRQTLERIIAGIRHEYEHDTQLLTDLGPVSDALTGTGLTRDQLNQQQTVVAEALAKANNRLAALRGGNEQVAVLIRGDWLLPPSLAASVADLQSTLRESGEAITQRNTDRAGELNATIAHQRNLLDESVKDWLGRYRFAVDNLTTALPTTAPGWPVSNLRRALGEAKTAAAEAPTDDLAARLGRANAVTADWQRDLAPCLRTVTDHYAERDAGLAATIRSGLADPDPVAVLGAVAEPLGRLVALPVPDQDKQHRVGETILEGMVVTPESATPAGENVPVVLPQFGVPLGQRLITAPGRAVTVVLGKGLEVIRDLALAVVACFVAYMAGHDAWVGTPAQVLAVIGWGFTLDLSVQAVTALFGGDAKLPNLTTETAK